MPTSGAFHRLQALRGMRRVPFLRYLVETRASVADEHGSTDDLFQALEIWSDDTPAGSARSDSQQFDAHPTNPSAPPQVC